MALHKRRMLAPINTVKHYVGQPRVSLGLGLSQSLEIADVVPAPVSNDREKVAAGSVIKSIHFEYWIVGNGASGTTSQFVFTIEKVPSGVSDPTFADLLNLGGYDNKKNVLFSSQGIIASAAGGQSVPIVRDWILIPKGKQRMGHKDRIVISFATVEQPLAFCGISTYKEYL